MNTIITKIKGTYFLNPLPHGTYRINGEGEFDLSEPTQYSEVPTIERIRRTQNIDHYTNSAGETLNKDDYDERKEYFLQFSRSGTFDNLEMEYAYKKFIREWSASYRDDTEYESVTVEVAEYPEAEEDYLKPIRLITGQVEPPLFELDIQMQQEFDTIAKELGFKRLEDRLNSSDTVGMNYSVYGSSYGSSREALPTITIGGKSTDYPLRNLTLGKLRGTTEELTQEVERVRKIIREELLKIKATIVGGTLSTDRDIPELRLRFEALNKDIRMLDPKVRDARLFRGIKEKLDSFEGWIVELERNAIKEE